MFSDLVISRRHQRQLFIFLWAAALSLATWVPAHSELKLKQFLSEVESEIVYDIGPDGKPMTITLEQCEELVARGYTSELKGVEKAKFQACIGNLFDSDFFGHPIAEHRPELEPHFFLWKHGFPQDVPG